MDDVKIEDNVSLVNCIVCSNAVIENKSNLKGYTFGSDPLFSILNELCVSNSYQNSSASYFFSSKFKLNYFFRYKSVQWLRGTIRFRICRRKSRLRIRDS